MPALKAVHADGENQLLESCMHCFLHRDCLPALVDRSHSHKMNEWIEHLKPIQSNAYIFRQEDLFHSIYFLKSGAVKTYTIAYDGQEKITGFYLPGEVFGIDGFSTGCYVSSAKALETTAICSFKFNRLQKLSNECADLQSCLFKVMSHEIQMQQQWLILLSKYSAEERVVFFLKNLSDRMRKRRLSKTCFHLPMSRIDIANFLGLSVETVSRTFTRLQQRGAIVIKGRLVDIKDFSEFDSYWGIGDSCQILNR